MVAVEHLMRRGAEATDQDGMIDAEDPPWASVKGMLFSNVTMLCFHSPSRDLRFARSRLARSVLLSNPTKEHMITLTDVDIECIATLTSLEYLDLQETDIEDDQLGAFAPLRKLKGLTLGPNVTKSGVDRFQRVLPDCIIVF